MIREPAVAGSFYPARPQELTSLLDSLLTDCETKKTVHGVIVPHAGYIYSGKIAGEVLSQVKIPSRVMLVGPNHHGMGANISVSNADFWHNPLGNVPVCKELSEALIEQCRGCEYDDQAHLYEHSLEVMLPFLQRLKTDIAIVPIALRYLSYVECIALAKCFAQVISAMGEEVLLVASSDMNHFLSAEENKKLDQLAIEAMTAYDPQALYEVVVDKQISMCGFLAAVVVMETARLLGGSTCKLINYAHSGLVNGDNHRVVGYAGLTLE